MIRVMIAARQNAGPGGRAQCGRMHIVIEQAACCQFINVSSVNRASVATQVSEAGLVQHDEQDIGRSLFRPIRRRPRR
jgi:hypothetical protein